MSILTALTKVDTLQLPSTLLRALNECEIVYTRTKMVIEPPSKAIASVLCESARFISREAKVNLGLDVSVNWENLMKCAGVFDFPITEI